MSHPPPRTPPAPIARSFAVPIYLRRLVARAFTRKKGEKGKMETDDSFLYEPTATISL